MPHPVAVARQAVTEWGAVQKGAELASFLALLMDLEPRTIVEIGSDAGGTLWAWQQVGARVIGVDLPYGCFGSGHELNDHGCEVIHGDSHDPATRDLLVKVLDGTELDVLFIDADHSYRGVKADYEMYGPLVRPGGLVVFHDICDHPEMPMCQVRAFWQSLEGDKEELVTDPPTWGGIGVLHVPEVT
jgi:cephalosporin hydroxylase